MIRKIIIVMPTLAAFAGKVYEMSKRRYIRVGLVVGCLTGLALEAALWWCDSFVPNLPSHSVFWKIAIALDILAASGNVVGRGLHLGTIGHLGGTVLFYAAIGALIGRALARRWQPPEGSCRACSYDLTGNVSGVRPECGTKIESP